MRLAILASGSHAMGISLPGAVRRRRSGRGLLLLLTAIAGLVLYLSGVGTSVERSLSGVRASIRTHAASGEFVLVEMDAKSLRALDQWPWPRSVHARALQALERAGASTIAFDIDFSSRSRSQEDARLAEALDQASVPVILPTFRQYASQGSEKVIEAMPLPALRGHAQLAAVNVFPDADGLVRSYPYAVVTDGIPRPSIGAMLANAAGRAGESFPIDTAIDPRTIPRVSYVDLLEGRVPPGALAGKTVLIGASAIELGDRYPVPGWGVLSGPAIQLLAAETLQAGSSPVTHGPWLPLGLTLLLLAFACRLAGKRQAVVLVSVALLDLTLPLALEMLHLGTVEVVPALFALALAGVWLGAANALSAFRHVRGTDQSSGLPNRRTLESDLAEFAAIRLAVLRIAGYSDVASLLGPARGAELVLRLGDRLNSCGVLAVYRIEESALAFLLPNGVEPAPFFERLAAALRPPVELAARHVRPDCAFGCAALDETGPAPAIDHALMAADQALERGQLWEEHSADLEGNRDWRLSLAGELDAAIAAGDIWVAYQPKLHIGEGRIVAAEALVRWTHPRRGEIYPDAFIPYLEGSGHILDLTLCVLDRAMEAAKSWQQTGRTINVAVNVSAPLLTKPAFVQAVEERMGDGRLAPELLTLEITESAALDDHELALAGMRHFAQLGIRLSVDDYGTGQSTLSYLKHLPAREIKIDKSFVLSIEENRSDQAMVRSTIGLAHELGFDVVAEGVETEAILKLLSEFGCDYAQGWHIGRPMPEDRFSEVIGSRLAA
jgi:EAL domain-containing protein (putative c-di-GMP-specific phosphodiesterase class I)/CHASE2 domain-containing sensor protein